MDVRFVCDHQMMQEAILQLVRQFIDKTSKFGIPVS